MQMLPINGAEIYYEPSFQPAQEATCIFEVLLKECSWQRRTGSFCHPVPRDEAYYGNPETRYTYSRREYKPLPWIPELLSLKSRIEDVIPDSAYANLELPRI